MPLISRRASRFAVVVMTFCLTMNTAISIDAQEGTEGGSGSGPKDRGETSFALVELFTSQGCSSCPAADDLLAELAQAHTRAGKELLALSFHVDYWNDLGWQDPFSTKANSIRQRSYAKAFAADGVYTPQMIVNGTTEFVGSNRARATAAIREALRRPRTHVLHMRTDAAGKNKFEVKIVARGPLDDTLLQVALVERTASSDVPRGENAGRILRHVNSVRELKSAVIDQHGRSNLSFQLPTGLDRKSASLIGVLQDSSTLEVRAATRTDLPPQP